MNFPGLLDRFGLFGLTWFQWLVLVAIVALATVFGMFAVSRLPRLTLTVGYDGRFSHGDYGIWVPTTPDRADQAAEVLRRHGALEVRNER